ncbi:helix-turn-helix transcriptional regulator [Enterococcus hirae]|nr:helix-turn-helix transcriptional regulator [Enterococcaceae bacterium]MDM8213685.1 helix-turn-helix transcriptional regulator [Enterococcus hirae]
MLLPCRMAVLNNLFLKKEEETVSEVMAALEDQYGTEKQFSEKMFLDHLMALEANGLVELTNYDLDDKAELVRYYKITADGQNTVEKYVDQKYWRLEEV